jgi:hypothetical protein
MHSLRKTLLAGHVWVTAVMTLIAGSPHLDCRCPDGHLKPFCLTAGSSPSACCCDGGCCATNSGGGKCRGGSASREGACPSCRRHRGQEQATSPRTALREDTSCCSRQLVQPESSVPTHTRPAITRDLTLISCPAPETAPALSLLPAAERQTPSWLLHLPGPPGDLLTLLQRFLI